MIDFEDFSRHIKKNARKQVFLFKHLMLLGFFFLGYMANIIGMLIVNLFLIGNLIE